MVDTLITGSEFVLALSMVNRWGATKVADYVARHGYDLGECINFLEIELESSDFSAYKRNLMAAKEELEANEVKHIKSISLFDEAFPKKLCEAKEPVVHLYYVGDINLLSSKCVAIIGTRTPNEPFISLGEKATKYLASKGLTVISGLALGCDTIAHRATLEVGGKTIAILPSSLDKVIPTQNRDLAREIVKNDGLVISEYSVTSTMNKFNYPQRDRIQSLLADSVLIVQSTDDGGTMIAAKKSLKDGKRVYAIEGNKLSLVDNYVDPSKTNQLDDLMN